MHIPFISVVVDPILSKVLRPHQREVCSYLNVSLVLLASPEFTQHGRHGGYYTEPSYSVESGNIIIFELCTTTLPKLGIIKPKHGKLTNYDLL